jgi:hypothetical protein
MLRRAVVTLCIALVVQAAEGDGQEQDDGLGQAQSSGRLDYGEPLSPTSQRLAGIMTGEIAQQLAQLQVWGSYLAAAGSHVLSAGCNLQLLEMADGMVAAAPSTPLLLASQHPQPSNPSPPCGWVQEESRQLQMHSRALLGIDADAAGYEVELEGSYGSGG